VALLTACDGEFDQELILFWLRSRQRDYSQWFSDLDQSKCFVGSHFV
jgi:hypothetical protein